MRIKNINNDNFNNNPGVEINAKLNDFIFMEIGRNMSYKQNKLGMNRYDKTKICLIKLIDISNLQCFTAIADINRT